MPESERTFTVTFRTQAELEAAQQALQALEKTKAAALEGARATKEAGEADKEAGKATEELTVRKSVLLSSLSNLRRELPGVAQAMWLVRNPLVALVSAATLAAGAIRKFTQEVQAEAERMQAFEGITQRFGRFSAVTAQSRLEAAQFAASLGRLAADAENAADKFGKLNHEVQRQAQIETERRNQKEALEREQVAALEQAGQISPSEAARRRMESNYSGRN